LQPSIQPNIFRRLLLQIAAHRTDYFSDFKQILSTGLGMGNASAQNFRRVGFDGGV